MRTTVESTAYDPARERAWHLSIWAGGSLTGWAVHELESGRCMALYMAPGEDLPNADRLPERPATTTFVALPEISTLVPESALTPGTEMQHLRLVHGSIATGLLRDEPLDQLGARCIYLHDEVAEYRLLKRFPAARSLSLQGLMVRNALRHAATGPVLLLHRTAQRVDLAVARLGSVDLTNAFHAVNGEDMLYYALFALDRCGLKPADVTVVIGGTHLTVAEAALLNAYLPLVKPSPHQGDSLVNGLALDVPERFSGLLDQFACAS